MEIDYTGAKILGDEIRRLRAEGVDVAVARLESVRAQASFAQQGLEALIGKDHLFHSVEEAIVRFAAGPLRLSFREDEASMDDDRQISFPASPSAGSPSAMSRSTRGSAAAVRRALLLHGYPQTHAMWHRLEARSRRSLHSRRRRPARLWRLRAKTPSSREAPITPATRKRAMGVRQWTLMRALGHRALLRAPAA